MKYGVILQSSDLQDVVSHFSKQDKFFFDVEAQGINRGVPHLAQLSWISLATYGVAVTIPFGHPIGSKIIGEKPEVHQYKTGKKTGEDYTRMVPVYDEPPEQISTANVFEILKPLFWTPGIRKIAHGGIYDLVATPKYWGGEVVPPPYGDTIVKQWLLNENIIGQLGLKDLVKRYYKTVYDPDNTGKEIEKSPFNEASKYTYMDAKYGWLVEQKLEPLIQEENLQEVYDLEMGVLGALIGMQLHGAKVDTERLHELQTVLDKQVIEAEIEIYKAAGKRFNINSNPQRQQILYGPKAEGGQALRPWKLTKGGKDKEKARQPLSIKDYSTDDDVLTSYPDNPVTVAMREYGDVHKILNTYVVGWLGSEEKPSLIFDEHIHADFVQYGTVTGRFSCRKPNLQNIPRPYTDLGQLVRGAFIPETDGKLVVADYSQIELVVLAHYLGKGKLFEAFQQGIDPHTMTAAMVLGKRPEQVTKVERQDLGKTLGFAVVYGAGLGKVASMAHISVQDAKRVLKKHAEMFPEIHAFKDQVIRHTKSRNPPYLRTLMGRKRRIQGLHARDDGIRMGAERQTFNSLIQGGAADILKYSMVRLDGMLPPDVHLIMTVHDELVVASPVGLADEVANILNEAMTGPDIQKLVKVPLHADIHIVDRWNEAK